MITTEKIILIKEKFIDLGYIDNIYLQKYLELVEHNMFTSKQSGKTQRHHVIPVECYAEKTSKAYNRRPAIKLASADNLNFEINLLYSDHLIAHAYLTLCTNPETIQAHYEEQSTLRKRNSIIGVTATNNALLSKKIKKEQADYQYLQQYYSEEDVRDIMNL